jgi:Zn-dependent protease
MRWLHLLWRVGYRRTPLFVILGFGLITHDWFSILCIYGVTTIHEFAHAAVFQVLGLGVKAITFGIVTAKTESRNLPDTRLQSALVALAGPASGLALSIGFLVGYLVSHRPELLLAAVIAAALNAFQVIPIPGLDGMAMWLAVSAQWSVEWGAISAIAVPLLAIVAAVIWHLWDLLLVVGIVIVAWVVAVVATHRRLAREPDQAKTEAAMDQMSENRPSGVQSLSMGLLYFGVSAGLFVITWYILYYSPEFKAVIREVVK